jgi:hypothetical protein
VCFAVLCVYLFALLLCIFLLYCNVCCFIVQYVILLSCMFVLLVLCLLFILSVLCYCVACFALLFFLCVVFVFCVLVYWTLPPGGNPIAVNKSNIIYMYTTKFLLPLVERNHFVIWNSRMRVKSCQPFHARLLRFTVAKTWSGQALQRLS